VKPFPRDGDIDAVNQWWAEHAHELADRSIAAGAGAQRITTWTQVAAFVDDAVWERILGDLAPASYAEAVAVRPSRTRHLSIVPAPEETP
jgi:hypothetical protein